MSKTEVLHILKECLADFLHIQEAYPKATITQKDSIKALWSGGNHPARNDLEAAFAFDIIDILIDITKRKIYLLENIQESQDVFSNGKQGWFHKITHYIGGANKSEHIANAILLRFNRKIAMYTFILHQFKEIPKDNINDIVASQTIVKDFIPDIMSVCHTFNMLYQHVLDECQNKPKKELAQRQDMDFVTLYKHYKEFYESISSKVDKKQILRVAAVLSNGELREMLGLKAIIYHPVTYMEKVKKALSSPSFNRVAFDKKLSSIIVQGEAMLQNSMVCESVDTVVDCLTQNGNAPGM